MPRNKSLFLYLQQYVGKIQIKVFQDFVVISRYNLLNCILDYFKMQENIIDIFEKQPSLYIDEKFTFPLLCL